MSTQLPQASYTTGWKALTERTTHRRSTLPPQVTTKEEGSFIIVDIPRAEEALSSQPPQQSTSPKTAAASTHRKPDPEWSKVYEQILNKKAAVEKMLAQRAPWSTWLAKIKQQFAPNRAYDLLNEKETSLAKQREKINAQVIRHAFTQWQKDGLVYPLQKKKGVIYKVLANHPGYIPRLYDSKHNRTDDFWELAYRLSEKEPYGLLRASGIPNTQLPAKPLSIEDQQRHDALEKRLESLGKNIKDLTVQYEREKTLFLASKKSFLAAHNQLST